MIDWLLHFAQTYPEVIAIAGGLIISFCATQYAYKFYPDKLTQKECYTVTTVLDFLICGFFTSNLWHYLDHDHDAHGFIVIGSLGVAICAPVVHSAALGYIMKRWPWLDSPKPGNPPPPAL